ncbi:MAG: ThuA domain-containing protein [Pseudomonadota bacterium]
MLKKILIGFVLVVFTLTGGGLVFIWQAGAWNILFPSSAHDVSAPKVPEFDRPAVLVFSKTNSFRHTEGIAAGIPALQTMAEKNGFPIFATENGAVFNAQDLSRFRVVVFLNATGDMLSAAQETAFKNWLEAGGGWLGIHAAGDGSHAEWTWYVENLIGAEFTAHILGPQFQTATVIAEDMQHSVNSGLPASWEAEEEWYSWKASPRERGFHIISTVDESTYDPVQNIFGSSNDLRMGDHPIAWSNCVVGGRTFYTAQGHAAAAFKHPMYLLQLENALRWLSSDGLCTPWSSRP